ncbi:MAG: hypothetical protein M3R24_28035 [Chloroflexota bacterium]|nr:hypothetical protein [Chloroflexota bacterium]
MTRDELEAAQAEVAAVRALYERMQAQMRRRVNLEIQLLRTTPEFRALLLEFVERCEQTPRREE